MATLKRALRYMLPFEGGYFFSRFDAGSKTRFGITEATAHRHGYTDDMRYFPKLKAIEIYKIDYWQPLRLKDVDQKIANAIFDMGVNAGIYAGAIIFQRALNIINVVLIRANYLQDLYADLKIDGQIGTRTLEAYRYIAQRGELKLLLKWIDVQKAKYYEACAEKQNKKNMAGILTQKSFIRSWSRRFFV